MLIIDTETKVDLLNNEAIARTIIKMLRFRPEHAVTLGVHGDWGAGKSSILEMIDEALKDEQDVVCLKFNGWRFQGFEDAKIALIEAIVTELMATRRWPQEIKNKFKGLFTRIDYLKIAKHGGQLAWNATTGLPAPGQIEAMAKGLQHLAAEPEDLVTRENIEGAAKNLGGFLKAAPEKRVPQEINEFRQDFASLLKEAGVAQLVVLVDDLDRCLPETAIQTLEAIRLFVSTERTVFVIGADEAMIEYAVRRHFPDLPDTTLPRDYARNYLEKLIQVPFRLAALGEAETRIYVALLLLGAEIGEEKPAFQHLIAMGRERLKTPWAPTPLDIQAVTDAVGGTPTERMLELLTLSDQITPMLARGFIGNPRQIKRFLNALLLRMNIAEARGFGRDVVSLPVLAKLMLAERFLVTVFEQIAASASGAADGTCAELAIFEPLARGEGQDAGSQEQPDPQAPGSPAVDASVGAGDRPLVKAWLGSDQVRTWGALEPDLGGVDLRPYLFVAKDKRDFFTGSSVLARLGELITALRGNTLAVRRQSVTDQITALSPTDASALFDELRIMVISASELKRKPEGMDGMVELVMAHPHLEEKLLDLLEGLPAERLGAWAGGGWEGCVRDPESKQRLQALFTRWASSGSSTLQAAVTIQSGKK